MAEHERTIPSRLSRLAVLADQAEATMFETSPQSVRIKAETGQATSQVDHDIPGHRRLFDKKGTDFCPWIPAIDVRKCGRSLPLET